MHGCRSFQTTRMKTVGKFHRLCACRHVWGANAGGLFDGDDLIHRRTAMLQSPMSGTFRRQGKIETGLCLQEAERK